MKRLAVLSADEAVDFSPGAAHWNDWRWQLRHSIDSAAKVAALMGDKLTDGERAGLAASPELFRVGTTPYYFSLVNKDHPACPVRRQIIPLVDETRISPAEMLDPLGEDTHNPTPAIVHKYPDRVLLLALDRCAIYCRHCNRRRLVGGDDPTTKDELERAFEYIARARRVRDVLISGGDPLILSTDKLDWILTRLRAIKHVEIIRIGTRVPVVLPMRIDDELCKMLRKHHPFFINTHFNHAKEITPLAKQACERLVNAGIPVGNQAVLLRTINSSVRSMRRLMRDLLKMRVKPYYLFQGDTVIGTDHLRTPVEKAVEIMDGMRGWMSGMAVPHLVLDAPGGGGKVPIGPNYIVETREDTVVVRNYRGVKIEYPQPRERDCTVPYDDVFFAGEPEDDDREGGVDWSAAILRVCRTAGIVDPASLRPLEQRLARRAKIVIAVAVDGAPLVVTARAAAAAYPAELAAGLELARVAVGASDVIVAGPDRIPDVARNDDAHDLALDAAQIVVPLEEDPIAHGVLVVSAQALIALARRVPVVDQVITVAGGVARPFVGPVPIGTSIEDLIEHAGGATAGIAWIALDGGPLGGRPLDRDDVITKSTRAIFVAPGDSELVHRARIDPRDALRRSLSADAVECPGCELCGQTAAASHAHPLRARLSMALTALRLGLGDAPAPAWSAQPIVPACVTIPLKQSLGVAATPIVRVGDKVVRGARIADLPDDALGVPAHASLNGTVTDVTAAAITIAQE